MSRSTGAQDHDLSIWRFSFLAAPKKMPAAPQGAFGSAAAGNAGGPPKPPRVTWLKWIYSRELRRVLSIMFEPERKKRPTPLLLKADYDLLKPIVESPPVYPNFVTEIDQMVTAEDFVRVLLKNQKNALSNHHDA